jgi:uncharacterized protein GlcG (DUF336 family)
VITLDNAQHIVGAALAHAAERGLPPMTVAVLDAGGSLIAFAKQDGSSLLREKIARGKAEAALNMGVGSRALAARAESHPHFFTALMAMSGGNIVPVAGGVLVRGAHDEIVAAVGVSGAVPDLDEACALAGIAATTFRADPGE